MEQVRITVIGVGGIANNIHLPVLAAMPEVHLCAVCDLFQERSQTASERFSIPAVYTSYHEMLDTEKPDAVFVLTEPERLFRVALDSLSAGCHVFLEKPMGINLLQAETLRTSSITHQRKLHVGFNRRYIPLVRTVLDTMRGLTRIEHIDGCFYKDASPSFYGGCSDAFWCDVIHVTDLVRHMAGGNALYSSMLESNAPESSLGSAWYSLVSFDNGTTGVIRSNYRTGGRVHRFELHGPGASAYIDLGFGQAACRAEILHGSSGSHSLSAAGCPESGRICFDGEALAKSNRYENYYGYRDEDRLFVRSILESPDSDDAKRSLEDLQTMRLVQELVDSKMPRKRLV